MASPVPGGQAFPLLARRLHFCLLPGVGALEHQMTISLAKRKPCIYWSIYVDQTSWQAPSLFVPQFLICKLDVIIVPASQG